MRVPCLISVGVLAAVFAVTEAAGDARAESQAGGLPAVAAQVTVLEGVANALQGEVTALQGQVDTLQSRVNALESQVTTLENRNSNLQSALDTEIANRQQADTLLETAILREILARRDADAAIVAGSRGFSAYNPEAQLVEGHIATVGTIGPLPAGSYAVVATASVHNSQNNANWECKLWRDDNNAVIGRTTEGTTSKALIGSIFGTSVGNVTIPALVTLSDNATMHMTCATGEAGSSVFDIQIVATSVGVATVGCGDIGAISCNQ